MGKPRGSSKKKGLADKVRSKKLKSEPKVNPFEIKVNRQKHQVLGKKVKHDRGKPGVSRSKAIQKRKDTLLVEYKKRGKVNKFVDRRFGENDPELSLEDRMLQRFSLERQRSHTKGDRFRLAEGEEGEELTHFGQSLSEIEQFDQPQDSEDDDDEGRISANIVGDEHFGGGFLTKKSSGAGDDTNKTWKEKMEEVIAKSKKEKYERQSEKERTAELTQKLDEEWKTIRAAMDLSKQSRESAQESSSGGKKSDDYDVTVRELQFEMKGKATDRLKTDEELAKKKKVPTATLR